MYTLAKATAYSRSTIVHTSELAADVDGPTSQKVELCHRSAAVYATSPP